MASTRKKSVIAVVVGLCLVVAGIALWAFAPWTAFVDKNVDEQVPDAPTVTAPATAPTSTTSQAPVPQVGNVVLASGTFRSFEHETNGKATLLRTADGNTVVRLTDFKTSNGPDVRVWLSQASASKADNADSGTYLDLGELKGNVGNQNYVVPKDAADGDWHTVVIWCERFSVAFGAADLNPVAPSPRQ